MARTAMKSFGVSQRTAYDSSGFYNRRLYNKSTHNHQDHHGLIHDNIEQTCDQSTINRIYNHSSVKMSELPDNCVHLMVTSPPYNVGKDYDDDLTEQEYYNFLVAIWQEVYRVLVPGGRACINVANLGRKPYIPINAMISQQMTALGYLMRGEIIWDKSASAGSSCAWGSWRSASNPVLRDTHEYILVFSKGQFNRFAKDKTSTITKNEFLEYTKSTWCFSAESAKRVHHPAPFPVELPRRLIQLYTFSDDVVLDPFMGSGTTAIAALKSSRHYVGYDISEDYVAIANRRIAAYHESLSC